MLPIGNWQGQATQFDMLGATPDPATVSPASGLVTYELRKFDWKLASGWSYFACSIPTAANWRYYWAYWQEFFTQYCEGAAPPRQPLLGCA
jgi:hypothetical protein